MWSKNKAESCRFVSGRKLIVMVFAFFGGLEKTKARSPRRVISLAECLQSRIPLRLLPERPRAHWVDGGRTPTSVRAGYNNLSVNPCGAPEGRGTTMRPDRATTLSFSRVRIGRCAVLLNDGNDRPTDGTGPGRPAGRRYSAVTHCQRCRLTRQPFNGGDGRRHGPSSCLPAT